MNRFVNSFVYPITNRMPSWCVALLERKRSKMGRRIKGIDKTLQLALRCQQEANDLSLG